MVWIGLRDLNLSFEESCVFFLCRECCIMIGGVFEFILGWLLLVLMGDLDEVFWFVGEGSEFGKGGIFLFFVCCIKLLFLFRLVVGVFW